MSVSSGAAQPGGDRITDVVGGAGFSIGEPRRGPEKWPGQSPTQLECQRIRGGDACGVLVAMVFPGGRDKLLDVREVVLQLPDVEPVQQRTGDHLPVAFGAFYFLVSAIWLAVSDARR